MNRQTLKDKLFEEFEKSWNNFLEHVRTAEATLNGKLAELAKHYGHDVIEGALVDDRITLYLKLRTDGAPTVHSSPAKKKKTVLRKKKRRKMHLTKKGRESHMLQAKYLNLLMKFKKSVRGSYKKFAKKEGRQAAIDRMTANLDPLKR